MEKNNDAVEVKRELAYLLIKIGIVIVVLWLVFAEFILVCRAPDNGMYPQIKGGDLLIGFRITGELQKDDVVVYEQEGERFVGRILGCEGDIITLDESGTVLVNGTVQTGEIMYSTYPKEGIEYPFTVEKDSVFVLGDYRSEAIDSRDFGEISLDDVKAKVDAVFRRKDI